MSLSAFFLGIVSQTHRGARRRFRNQLENLFGLDRKNSDRTVAEVILTLPDRQSSLPWVDRFLGQGRGRRFLQSPHNICGLIPPRSSSTTMERVRRAKGSSLVRLRRPRPLSLQNQDSTLIDCVSALGENSSLNHLMNFSMCSGVGKICAGIYACDGRWVL